MVLLQIPGGPELIIIFMILTLLGLPILAILAAVYIYSQRSSRVAELEDRVEELESERRGGE